MARDQRVSAPYSSPLGARAFGPLPDGNECHRGATGALIYSWERGPLARFLM